MGIIEFAVEGKTVAAAHTFDVSPYASKQFSDEPLNTVVIDR